MIRDLWYELSIPMKILCTAILILALLAGIMTIKKNIKGLNSKKEYTPGLSGKANIEFQAGQSLLVDKKENDYISFTYTDEKGKTVKLKQNQVELDRNTVPVTGTEFTIHAKYNNAECDVECTINRELLYSFNVGYPNEEDVTANIYTNGELVFEGTGDIMHFERYPWKKYDNSKSYPITAIYWGENVKPTNIDEMFKNIETLVYADKLPDSIISAVCTFEGCTSLEAMADASECNELLNISGMYKDCINLKETFPISESVRLAENTFEDCVSLKEVPDLTKAINLKDMYKTFSGCNFLITANLAPNAVIITGCFENCYNIRNMPIIPDTVEYMSACFSGCSSLSTLETIPKNVKDISNTFKDCEVAAGTITINATPENYSGVFSGASIATILYVEGSCEEDTLKEIIKTSTSNNIAKVGDTIEVEELSDYDRYRMSDDSEEELEEGEETETEIIEE